MDYLDEEHKIKGNCLAIGMMGMQFFYMQKDFYAGQFTKRAIPKTFSLTQRLATYFIVLLNKNQNIFKNVLVRNFEKEFNDFKIQLPTKNNKPDFEFMENFISQIEAERVTKIQNYLEINGLKDYNLTDEEKKVLDNFNNIQWNEFKIGELFESSNGDFDIQKKHINGKGTYVITSGLVENGILGKTDIKAKIFEKNTITIDMFGNAFYRNFNYKLVTHARVFSLKPKFNTNEKQTLFLTNSFSFFNKKFGYDNMCSWTKIKKDTIYLPTKNNKPDYKLMETLISAIQKQIVKNLIFYLAKFK